MSSSRTREAYTEAAEVLLAAVAILRPIYAASNVASPDAQRFAQENEDVYYGDAMK